MTLVVAVSAALAGCGGGEGDAARKPVPPPANLGSPEGTVAVTVDGEGFHPNLIAARAGHPITLAVTRTTNETCGTEIVIPSLGIERALPLHQTVEVTLTPAEKGTITFACGMDMLKGSIVVQ
jgi:Cu(I)/Ag(I) efflux system membrane fusion protein